MKLIEMPVTEEMQLGITNGLLMNDYIPILAHPERYVFQSSTCILASTRDFIPNQCGFE